MKNIIVISAHPDDEVLGAGGTLLKHKNNGDNIYWIITTKIYENQGFPKELFESRQSEIQKVSTFYGMKNTFILDYPTMSLTNETLLEMIPKISNIFNEVKPEIIYCLNRSDAHSDHRITFDAIMACTKSFRYPFIKQVYMYECISETEFAPPLAENVFLPNHYVDISEYMDGKLEIMKVYSSELGEHPFPRSIRNIEALATFRGASAGVEYAEAFQLVKSIDK
jgi:LmbE family N-acetylglucosaminyl deacetylase